MLQKRIRDLEEELRIQKERGGKKARYGPTRMLKVKTNWKDCDNQRTVDSYLQQGMKKEGFLKYDDYLEWAKK